MYKYQSINDKIGRIELDNYNRENSELTFIEAKLIKTDDYLNVIGVLTSDDGFGNIIKPVKLPDGKYGNDPSFKLEGTPVVCLTLPLKIIKKVSKAGKEYNVGTQTEIFVAEKLLEDFDDGGTFEGVMNPGIDCSITDRITEMLTFGEPGIKKAKMEIAKFYQCDPVETLTVITDEIVAQCTTVQAKSGGKSYPKAETEAEKINARSNYVKRFLSDIWDESTDISAMSWDECLTYFNGRESVQKNKNGELLKELLRIILP